MDRYRVKRVHLLLYLTMASKSCENLQLRRAQRPLVKSKQICTNDSSADVVVPSAVPLLVHSTDRT